MSKREPDVFSVQFPPGCISLVGLVVVGAAAIYAMHLGWQFWQVILLVILLSGVTNRVSKSETLGLIRRATSSIGKLVDSLPERGEGSDNEDGKKS